MRGLEYLPWGEWQGWDRPCGERWGAPEIGKPAAQLIHRLCARIQRKESRSLICIAGQKFICKSSTYGQQDEGWCPDARLWVCFEGELIWYNTWRKQGRVIQSFSITNVREQNNTVYFTGVNIYIYSLLLVFHWTE